MLITEISISCSANHFVMKKLLILLIFLCAYTLQAQTIAAPTGGNVAQSNTRIERIDGLERLEDAIGVKVYMQVGTQIVIGIRDKKVLWRADVITSCGVPKEGIPEIKSFQLLDGKIAVTYGKKCGATIDPENGKIVCMGCD